MLADGFLPTYDVAKRHDIDIAAPVEHVYATTRELDMSHSPLIRSLFALRSLPSLFVGRDPEQKALGLTLDGLLASGFCLLADDPPHEFVLGLVGRFWTPSGGLRRISPSTFVDFNEPGYAKAVWNFHLTPLDRQTTRLSTETRVRCTDDASRRRFHLYWAFVGPFSGLIRREMLWIVRRKAIDGKSQYRSEADPV